MSLESKASELSRSVSPYLLSRLRTEAGSNLSLVLPMLSDVLGYDWRNPDDIEPEFGAGGDGARADFVVLPSMPFMVVECKSVSEGVRSVETYRQLKGYYEGCGAVFGVLTDGLHWRFYGGFEVPGEMDATPFLCVYLEGLTGPDLEGLKVLAKGRGVGPAICWAAQRWLALQTGPESESREGIEARALAVVREILRGAGHYGDSWLQVHTCDSNIFYGSGVGRKRLCRLEFRGEGCGIGLYGAGNDTETGRVDSIDELRGRVGEIVRRVEGDG